MPVTLPGCSGSPQKCGHPGGYAAACDPALEPHRPFQFAAKNQAVQTALVDKRGFALARWRVPILGICPKTYHHRAFVTIFDMNHHSLACIAVP
nr:MAG TPA: hypothetical protein [Caudoviricetes sp.]